MQGARENGREDKKVSLTELDDWSLHQIRKHYPVYFLMPYKGIHQSLHILLQIMLGGFYLSVPLRSWVTMYWPLTDSCRLFFNTASIHLSNHLGPYDCYTSHAASSHPFFFLICFSSLYSAKKFPVIFHASLAFLALRIFSILKQTC